MLPPVMEKILYQLDRIKIHSAHKHFKSGSYALLPMASTNPTNREPDASVGKNDVQLMEDIEALRSSRKSKDDVHTERVELTEEDVRAPFQTIDGAWCNIWVD